MRIGNGYDLHRLEPGGGLILGGIAVPFDKGLIAHSDGDVLAHAITDALLGAAALGNIGQHFPDTDPQYKDADSIGLLQEVHAILEDKGFHILNIDTTVVAEEPKLNPFLDDIRENLARSLDLPIDCVSVKAKTNEGLGPEGRGEAISAHATVLIDTP